MNIVQREPYRKRIHPGDYFGMEFVDGGFVIGRVVGWLEMETPPLLTGYLVYIFRGVWGSFDEWPETSCQNLMFGPRLVNRLGWSRGYLRHIAHKAIEPGEVFERHCFPVVNPAWSPTGYVDDAGRPCWAFEPMSNGATGNYRTLDGEISLALGLDMETAGL